MKQLFVTAFLLLNLFSTAYAQSSTDQIMDGMALEIAQAVAIHHWGFYAQALDVDAEAIETFVCSEETIRSECKRDPGVTKCDLTCYGVTPESTEEEENIPIAQIAVEFNFSVSANGELSASGLVIKTLKEFNYERAQAVLDYYDE